MVTVHVYAPPALAAFLKHIFEHYPAVRVSKPRSSHTAHLTVPLREVGFVLAVAQDFNLTPSTGRHYAKPRKVQVVVKA